MGQKRIAIPPSIKESTGVGGAVIERYWHPGWLKLIPVIIFTCVWDGFLYFWYSVAWSGSIWPALILGSGHLAIGIGLAYYILVSIFNRTEYRVTDSELVIKSGPLPVTGNRRIPRGEITQLFVSEDRSTDSYGGSSASYEVHMIDCEGRQKKIIKGLEDAHEGLFLEHRLEELMGIEPEDVAGAYSG